jgi:hypothetical protein
MFTPRQCADFLQTECDPWYVYIVDREPYLSDNDGMLDQEYPEEYRPVKPWTEVVADKEAEGWDLAHGYDPSPVEPSVSSVAAGTPVREDSSTPATFTLSCIGDCSGVNVNFSIGGTAEEGVHYTIDKSSPQPAGTVINVAPIHDPNPGDNKTVSMSIDPGAGYNVGTHSSTIEIVNVEGPANPPNEIKVTLGGHVTIDHTGSIIVT